MTIRERSLDLAFHPPIGGLQPGGETPQRCPSTRINQSTFQNLEVLMAAPSSILALQADVAELIQNFKDVIVFYNVRPFASNSDFGVFFRALLFLMR